MTRQDTVKNRSIQTENRRVPADTGRTETGPGKYKEQLNDQC